LITPVFQQSVEPTGGLFAVLALGFFLGVRHATDPDHVIAVTTLVARYRRVSEAAMIGAWWGVGHTLTIIVVGGAIILFGVVIPPRLGLSMEFAVAVMLILLGVMNLLGFWRIRAASIARSAGDASAPVHSHAHEHGDYIHTHPHSQEPESHPHRPEETPLGRLDRRLGGLSAYQALRPLVVGVVHGLAGSAAVTLLILAAITDRRWAMLYLLVFGVGTILGMMLLTGMIAVPLARATSRNATLHRRLGFAAGLLSLVFGLILAVQLGVVDGLFSANPTWTPK
jgi:high-affinity nickel-transport protein